MQRNKGTEIKQKQLSNSERYTRATQTHVVLIEWPLPG